MSVSINPINRVRSTKIHWGHADWGRADFLRGRCIVADVDGELCWLDINPAADAVTRLRKHFAGCTLHQDEPRVRALLDQAFGALSRGSDVAVRAFGSAFRFQVWQALTRTAPGERVSYGQLAEGMGRPAAARAVGSAAAANTVALFIPCHRLVRASGESGAFRWGAALKQKLLDAERALPQNSIYGHSGTNKLPAARLA